MFLMFANEGERTLTEYARKMFAPFWWVQDWLFEPLPIKLRPFDFIMIVLLFAAGRKGQRVAEMRSVLLLAVGTTVALLAFGMVRGGDARAASWQVYLMLVAPLAAFAIAATHFKAEHFRSLATVIVAAACYRAAMSLIFYFFYVRNTDDVPPMMANHYDTVLWVVAIGVLIIGLLHHRSGTVKAAAFLGLPLILFAIHFNNRRLAWVSLAGSLAALYFLLPKSAPKRRLQRAARLLVPVLAGYVVIGWGRPERIFKPLASLSSVSSTPDQSTLARNVENLSLIATASYSPLAGNGWGHRYVELSSKYSIADAMELWPYVPHNSILGLFGYTGFLGVLGYWMMFPVAVFFNARVARLAKDPYHRSIGLVGVIIGVTCMNQMFGDMGIFSPTTMYMMALSWAAALRIPLEAGVWGQRTAQAALPRSPEVNPMMNG
jgi:hypothetical protein